MTYEAEAVIPLETSFPTSRTSSFNPSDNDEQLTKSLDLIEEKRENAINANGLCRIYTNQGEFLIRYPAYDHLLNGV